MCAQKMRAIPKKFVRVVRFGCAVAATYYRSVFGWMIFLLGSQFKTINEACIEFVLIILW